MEARLEVAEEPAGKVHFNGAISVQPSRAPTQRLSLAETKQREREAHKAYGRGKKIDVKNIRDKKLRRNLSTLEHKYKTATAKAKDAEILLENTGGFLEPESELERTWKVNQKQIQRDSTLETAAKKFELKLQDLGPYICEYSRSGRDLLLAGRKGHVATFDWREKKPHCELQLKETVRDAKWLHNNQYFAVSQKNQVYIYDNRGVELHCLKQHREVTHMEFLPHHFLLGTLSTQGILKWMDTSTGKEVAEGFTHLGTPVSLAQNPYNAILHVGHQNGTITLWSPNSAEPLVKLLAHKGPVRAMAIDREGRYMVTAGQESQMAVWDIRNFKEVNSYFTRRPASTVAISDTGLTAVGWGTHATIWRGLFDKNAAVQQKVQSPYMTWGGQGQEVERLRWCPYDDVLGVGHDEGFSSVVIPGAGEANFDALEVNPFETASQRQETEVRGLLHKLQPEMIALDPNFVGNLDLRSEEQRRAEKDLDAAPVDVIAEMKNKARGKNSALKKFMRKQRKKNIIDEKKLRAEEAWKDLQKKNLQKREEAEEDLGPALGRFAKRE